MGKCTQHFGARLSFLSSCRPPSFLPSLPLSFPSSCRDYVLLSCWFSILLPFSFDRFVRGSRCKFSMQQVCQLLWGGEQPTALAAAWAEGMSAVASVEASYSVSYFITYVNIRPSPHFNQNLQTQGRRHIVIVFAVVIVMVLIIIVMDIDKDIDIDTDIIIIIFFFFIIIIMILIIIIFIIIITITITTTTVIIIIINIIVISVIIVTIIIVVVAVVVMTTACNRWRLPGAWHNQRTNTTAPTPPTRRHQDTTKTPWTP